MSGIEAIAAERQRQMSVEGWSTDHDDRHTDGALASAAAAYAFHSMLPDSERPASVYVVGRSAMSVIRWLWPEAWGDFWWKPKSRREDLVRAGALIAAEIDRLDRLEKSQS